jgi:energy-converting hydrogenase B subunit D
VSLPCEGGRDDVSVLQIVILLLVAAGGTGVVLTRDPLSQAVGVSFFGLLLAVLFLVFQAPDVALSAIVVGALALPLMILLALAKTRGRAG